MLSEADTCRTFVTKRLYAAGWTDDQIAEQRTFTDGRIFVTNGVAKRGKPKRADYLLYYQPSYPLAVVEAKAAYRSPTDGVQQAKDYATTLGLLFAYATNGQGIIEIDLHAGTERAVDAFPSPTTVWARYRAAKGLPEELENRLLVPNQTTNSHPPRYYQQIAINRAIEAVLGGKRRVLLTLATGTGKTVIAFQIAWKLWRGEWNARGVAGRKPRILFLADRQVLVDDPKDKTFAPFGDARYRIGGGPLVTSREVYFSTYQALYGDVTRPPRFRELAPDFFDLIIVDEAHRGSARDTSSWREILEYFSGAVQLGMTATPLREDNRDTYEYFGNPVYTYSLRQGIQDGFLAPYQVRRVVIDLDATGWRPFAGQRDDAGREIPDREYESPDFERVISLPRRTEAIARHLTAYLKATNRFDKTLVFCVDQEHASQMRAALANANADLTRQYPNYVARVTGDEGDLGKALLSTFQDVESTSPVILTTSQMLTTGVDAPTVKNVVLVKHIGSMTDFKQIIGRGTRVREDRGKLYFTILDYTGAATRKFADPDFDGMPARIIEEFADKNGVTEEEKVQPAPPDVETDVEITIIDGRPKIYEPKGSTRRQKYIISEGVEAYIIGETVQLLDADGRKLRTEKLTDYTGKQLRTLYPSADALRGAWARGAERNEIVAALDERGIALDQLAAVMGQPDADPFDLLCSLAFRTPVLTRRERANRLRRDKREFLTRYTPQAKEILESLLDQYATYGPEQLKLPDVLELPAIAQRGTIPEIIALFGGADQLREAVTELQTLLYAA